MEEKVYIDYVSGIFQALDKSGNGVLSYDELKAGLEHFSEKSGAKKPDEQLV